MAVAGGRTHDTNLVASRAVRDLGRVHQGIAFTWSAYSHNGNRRRGWARAGCGLRVGVGDSYGQVQGSRTCFDAAVGHRSEYSEDGARADLRHLVRDWHDDSR